MAAKKQQQKPIQGSFAALRMTAKNWQRQRQKQVRFEDGRRSWRVWVGAENNRNYLRAAK